MPSAHDYRSLVSRWRAVCRRAGLRLRRHGEAGLSPLFHVRTPALRGQEGVYFSAGIHGDEPAGAQALLEWAEALGPKLRDVPALLFPCLNPWGFTNNIRLDADGVDLNRSFHREELPFVSSWREVLGEQSFKNAVCLHEDYDGEGLYLYEVGRDAERGGRALLEAAAAHVPVDQRQRIDKFSSNAGLIRRRLRTAFFERIGYPEAVWLYRHHARNVYTVEAPSEFALAQRVAALRAVLDRALTL